MKTSRTIAVITGTRAEYGHLRPVLKAIQDHRRLKLSIMATGMHLSPQYGLTYREIENDGFKINAKVDMLLSSDTAASMAKSLGVGIVGITQALEAICPDLLLYLGDRGEGFAGVLAAVHMGIPVAHLHGGETVGNALDEAIRHSITKFAHLHLPATEDSAQRIRKLGEESWRIHVVGAPCLDTILHERLLPKPELSRALGWKLDRPIFLVAQHPVTTETDKAADQIRQTLDAVTAFEADTVVVCPNSDAGNYQMLEVIRAYERYPFLHVYPSLSHTVYLSLMKAASVMIGNSSSGIIEAPSFHLPVINIGRRQQGRQRANNIIDVPHDTGRITSAIRRALSPGFQKRVRRCVNPYGDGRTGPRVAEILSRLEISPRLFAKKITY